MPIKKWITRDSLWKLLRNIFCNAIFLFKWEEMSVSGDVDHLITQTFRCIECLIHAWSASSSGSFFLYWMRFLTWPEVHNLCVLFSGILDHWFLGQKKYQIASNKEGGGSFLSLTQDKLNQYFWSSILLHCSTVYWYLLFERHTRRLEAEELTRRKELVWMKREKKQLTLFPGMVYSSSCLFYTLVSQTSFSVDALICEQIIWAQEFEQHLLWGHSVSLPLILLSNRQWI